MFLSRMYACSMYEDDVFTGKIEKKSRIMTIDHLIILLIEVSKKIWPVFIYSFQ